MASLRPKTIFESFKLLFLLLRISGYEFFSIRVETSHKLIFHQSRADLFFFLISVTYSMAAVFIVEVPSFDGIKSPVLINGIKILYRALMTSVIYTKMKRFRLREESFKSLVEMMWMEQRVK